MTNTDPGEPMPASEDGLPAIATFSGWVNNADTKTGLLAVAAAALASGYIGQYEQIRTRTEGWGTVETIAGAVLAAGAITLIIAGAQMFLALRPQYDDTVQSRYSWPYLSQAPIGTVPAADAEHNRQEAWIQARALARIVRSKYRRFRSALTWLACSGVLYVVGLVLLS